MIWWSPAKLFPPLNRGRRCMGILRACMPKNGHAGGNQENFEFVKVSCLSAFAPNRSHRPTDFEC